MNIQKVYDAQGNHVDSFRRCVKKSALYNRNLSLLARSFSQQVKFLNSRNLFVKKQFSNLKASTLFKYGAVPPQTYLKSITAAIKEIF